LHSHLILLLLILLLILLPFLFPLSLSSSFSFHFPFRHSSHRHISHTQPQPQPQHPHTATATATASIHSHSHTQPPPPPPQLQHLQAFKHSSKQSLAPATLQSMQSEIIQMSCHTRKRENKLNRLVEEALYMFDVCDWLPTLTRNNCRCTNVASATDALCSPGSLSFHRKISSRGRWSTGWLAGLMAASLLVSSLLSCL